MDQAGFELRDISASASQVLVLLFLFCAETDYILHYSQTHNPPASASQAATMGSQSCATRPTKSQTDFLMKETFSDLHVFVQAGTCRSEDNLQKSVLSLPYGSQGPNFSQTWWQVPSPAEPSCSLALWFFPKWMKNKRKQTKDIFLHCCYRTQVSCQCPPGPLSSRTTINLQISANSEAKHPGFWSSSSWVPAPAYNSSTTLYKLFSL